MATKRAKHNEVILKHIPRTHRTHRTTIRVYPDEWQLFIKSCHQYGLTTCFVLRCFIHQWFETLHGKSDILKTNSLLGSVVYQDTNIKKERWIYSKMAMTLYDPKHLAGRQRTAQRQRLEKQCRYRRIV